MRSNLPPPLLRSSHTSSAEHGIQRPHAMRRLKPGSTRRAAQCVRGHCGDAAPYASNETHGSVRVLMTCTLDHSPSPGPTVQSPCGAGGANIRPPRRESKLGKTRQFPCFFLKISICMRGGYHTDSSRQLWRAWMTCPSRKYRPSTCCKAAGIGLRRIDRIPSDLSVC